MLLCAHNRWNLTPCISVCVGGGGFGGGAMSLCQVACEYVVAVGLGLQFL
jgi:hypothetical protein